MKIRYIIFAYFSLLTIGLVDNARGPLYPEILNFFQANRTQGSLIFSLASFAGLLSTAVSSWWRRKFGIIFSLRIFVAINLLATVGMGSSYWINSFSVLLMSSLLYGVSVGGMGVCMNILIEKGSSSELKVRLFAGLHSMYALASLSAPTAVKLLIDSKVPWGSVFMFLSIVPLGCLIYGSFVERDTSEHTNKSVAKLSNKVVALVGFIFSMYVTSEVILSSRLVLIGKDVWGLNFAEASNYLSLFFLLLFIGRASFAIFTIKINAYYLLLLSSGSSLVCYLLGLYFHPVFLSLCGLTMSFFFPCGMDWLSGKFQENAESLIAAVMVYISVALVSGHWIVGILGDQLGTQNAMLLGPILLGCVLTLLLKSNRSL